MRPRAAGKNTIRRQATFYGVGAGVIAIASFALILPPRNATNTYLPPAIISGTPLPALLNSADAHCGGHPRCTDAEFDAAMSDLQRQWAITPEWLRFACVASATLPSMEGCIVRQTESWRSKNPNRQAPWLNPANVGEIVSAAGK